MTQDSICSPGATQVLMGPQTNPADSLGLLGTRLCGNGAGTLSTGWSMVCGFGSERVGSCLTSDAGRTLLADRRSDKGVCIDFVWVPFPRAPQQRKNDFPNDKSLAGKRDPTFVLHLRHIYLACDDACLRTHVGVHERQPTKLLPCRLEA
jgi:hypothetical protein